MPGRSQRPHRPVEPHRRTQILIPVPRPQLRPSSISPSSPTPSAPAPPRTDPRQRRQDLLPQFLHLRGCARRNPPPPAAPAPPARTHRHQLVQRRPRHRTPPSTPARSPPPPTTARPRPQPLAAPRRQPARDRQHPATTSQSRAAPGCATPPPSPHPPATTPPPHTPPRSHPANDPPPHPAPPPPPATPPPATPSPPTAPAAPHQPAPAPAHPPPPQHLIQRPVHIRRQRRRALRQPRREHRRTPRQLPPHPHPLRTLTREHEHRPARATAPRPRRYHPGRRLTRRHRPSPATSSSRSAADHHRTVSNTDRVTASDHRHIRHTSPRTLASRTRRSLAACARPAPPASGRRRARPSGAPGGTEPERRPRAGVPSAGASSRITCALVPLIPNADTPARRGPPSPRATAPARSAADTRARRPVHLRRGLVRVQRPRQHAVPQRQHHLDHPGRRRPPPGCGRCSTSPSPATAAVGGAVLAVGGQQRLRLDRVAQRRCRAVRLDHVDVRRAQPGVGQRGPDDPLLGRAVRRGQPVGRAVLVDRAARAPPPAPGARCAARPTAAPARASRRPRPSPSRRRPRERLAPAVGGQRPLPGEARRTRRASPSPSRRRPAPVEHSPGRSACAARCRATSDDEHAVSTVTAGPSRPRV